MFQILPFRPLIVAAASLAVLLVAVIQWGSGTLGLEAPTRWAVLLINGLVLLASVKWVWRFVWRRVRPLRHWFPDLNGTYDVELQSNWPIVKALLDAGMEGVPFDPRQPETVLPALMPIKLKARIDLGFYSAQVTMWSEVQEGNRVIIDRSRTLSTTLLRPCDGHPHRLIYTYQQVNRRDRMAASDDTAFEGTAILAIEDVESGELRGQFWSNRGWHRGLATAGIIVFKRIGSD